MQEGLPYAEKVIEDSIEDIDRYLENMLAYNRKILKILESDANDIKHMESIKDELENEKRKYYQTIVSLKLSFEEESLTKLSEYSSRILVALENFNVMSKDYSKFSITMTKFSDAVKKRHEIDAQALHRLWNSVKMGYYPTDPDNLKLIIGAIHIPNYEVNLLDPCCGCGNAVSQISKALIQTRSYGVEIDELRAEEARPKLTRLGKGSFFYSRISNEAFHLMYLNPPYLMVHNNEGFNTRAEKRFLVESMNHLMYGGMLIYVIPYYRITPDIARILTDNFKDIRVYKFIGNEFGKYKQVAILGIRKEKGNGAYEASRLVKFGLYPETIPDLSEITEPIYKLPKEEKTVQIFKGAVFDEIELAEQMKKSNMIEDVFKESTLDNIRKRPMLPFKLGQIGLIGGSGAINGFIDCDVPHVLKGRITKERKETGSSQNIKGEKIGTTEAVINKMTLKILTVDGVKSLV